MDVDLEKEISSDFVLKIIDMILLNETSLNKQPVRCLNIIFNNIDLHLGFFHFIFKNTASETITGLSTVSCS